MLPMLTYTSQGEQTIRLQNTSKTVLAFPQDKVDPECLNLRTTPQDDSDAHVVSWPGEYDYNGVSVRGIGHDEGTRVSYAIECDGIRTAFIATPLHDWNDHEIELLGDVDVLCIPADDPKLVQTLIDEVDPRVLIPLKTKDDATFNEVINVCGAKDNEVEKSFQLKSRGSLPSEGRTVVILK